MTKKRKLTKQEKKLAARKAAVPTVTGKKNTTGFKVPGSMNPRKRQWGTH